MSRLHGRSLFVLLLGFFLTLSIAFILNNTAVAIRFGDVKNSSGFIHRSQNYEIGFPLTHTKNSLLGGAAGTVSKNEIATFDKKTNRIVLFANYIILISIVELTILGLSYAYSRH